MRPVKKQCVSGAIGRVKQEYLPTQINYTPKMKDKVLDILGIPEDSIDEKLGNHIKYICLDDMVRVDKEKNIGYDIWGVGWDLASEGFEIKYHPLIDSDNLKDYKFPEPDDKLMASFLKLNKDQKSDYFILFWLKFTLFERSWTIRGMEKMLTDFYFRKKEVEYFLDGITEFNIKMAQKALDLGFVDGLRTGDDFGTQKGMLMSPDMWRDLFKDRYQRLWGTFKDKGLPVFHHSCGNIMELIPDLIDIGLDVLTPVQPEALDLDKLVGTYGKDLSFLGGISTQSTLPFGTPREVRAEVKDRIELLGRYGGYIVAPSHQITSDCKAENFVAFMEALEEYREKGFIK